MNEIFASRLKMLREERDLSQSELANKISVSRGSISFYENKSRVPDIEVLAALCNYFSVSSDYLLGLSHIRNKSHVDLFSLIMEEVTDQKNRNAKSSIEKLVFSFSNLCNLFNRASEQLLVDFNAMHDSEEKKDFLDDNRVAVTPAPKSVSLHFSGEEFFNETITAVRKARDDNF